MSPDVRERARRMGLHPYTLRTLEAVGFRHLRYLMTMEGCRREVIEVDTGGRT